MLNIKRPETYELAKKLAERTGESLTEAVTRALEERLARLEAVRRAEIERKVADVMQMGQQYRSLIRRPIPTLKDLDDEMYDEFGLPR